MLLTGTFPFSHVLPYQYKLIYTNFKTVICRWVKLKSEICHFGKDEII